MTLPQVIRRLLLGAAAALFLCSTTAPAFAVPVTTGGGGLSYSADGVSYAARPPEIFADAPKLVPGEAVRGRLWLRNDSDAAVDVAVDIPDAGQHGGILVAAWISAAGGTLESGADASITVQAWLPPDSGNATQNMDSTDLKVKIHVSSTPPQEPTDLAPDGTPSDDGLGNTGATAGIWPLGVGALVVGGTAYAASRRRTRAEGSAEHIEEGEVP